MPLILDALSDAWVVHRSPTGAVLAALPGGIRLSTSELLPVPDPGSTDAWLLSLARTHLPQVAALTPVAFTSTRGWPVDALEARTGERAITVVAYRFGSHTGVVVVSEPLDALTAEAMVVVASGRPAWS